MEQSGMTKNAGQTAPAGPIHRQMNIMELANKHPEAVAVMAERGLHCFGCHGASYDTVEAGAQGHGLPEEEIDKMVDEMNQVVLARAKSKEQPSTASKDLTLTEKAAKKLIELMAAEKKSGYGLRVQVVPGGCSGFSYALDFDNNTKDGDIVLDKHGIKVFIDKDSLDQLHGGSIDYVDSLQGSGFKIDNPNAHSTCGCGKSFA